MFDAPPEPPGWRGNWLNRLIAAPRFQAWAAAFPLTRKRTRADGQAIFDIVQGFVQSQVLMALVELQVLERLRAGPRTAESLGLDTGIEPDRMRILLQAACALGLLRQRRGRYGLARKGAAILGVPGLRTMIRHHGAFYRDMADPVALLRGPEMTELAAFWPYVFGREAVGQEAAETYSDLMTQSQALVAQDTLAQVSLRGVKRLLDVGGGTGEFLRAVARSAPNVALDLMDLREVVAGAPAAFDRAGLSGRARIHAGSFRDDPLPHGADAISLVRVLYDHGDETVASLLAKVFDTLPPGGRLIISEPMGGGAQPDRSGDVYFAFYTLAMQTGRARSPQEIAALCRAAGFDDIRSPRPRRPFITRVLTAVKPS